MRKRNYAFFNVECAMKKRPRGKLTAEQLTPYVADRSYQSMKTAKISLTKRAESMKVSLPTLKCLENAK